MTTTYTLRSFVLFGLLTLSTALWGQFEIDSLHGIIDNQIIWGQLEADIDLDGDLDLLFSHPGFHGGLTIYRNDGNNQFDLHQFTGDISWISPDYALRYAIGDLDQDGDPDCIGDREAADEATPFWANDGLGNFDTTQLVETTPFSTGILQLEIADSDGDSWPEIWMRTERTIRLKTRTSVDEAFVEIPLLNLTSSSEWYYHFLLLDVDQDNDLDLLLHKRDWINGETYRLRYEQTAPHTFILAEETLIPDWGDHFDVGPVHQAADFDQDGWMDYVLHFQHSSYPATVQVYRNEAGSGNFSFQGEWPALEQVSLGDLDADGVMDIIGLRENELTEMTEVVALRNTGAFTFTEQTTDAVLYGSEFKAIDLNNDGRLDVLNWTGDYAQQPARASVQTGLSNPGNFGPETDVLYHLGRLVRLHAEDADQDGDLDLFCVDNHLLHDGRISYFENEDGAGNFGPKQDIGELGQAATFSLFHDFNGDGIPDLLSAEQDANWLADLHYYPSMGALNYGPGQAISGSVHRLDDVFTFLDLDGDGHKDLLSVSSELDFEAYLYDPGTDGFTGISDFIDPPALAGNEYLRFVYAFDPDQDGDDDLVVTAGTRLFWAEHLDGSGTFDDWSEIPIAAGRVSRIKHADLDGDGDLDMIAMGSQNNGNDHYFLLFRWDQDSQNFSAPTLYRPDQYFHDYAIGDFTHDGIADLLSNHGFQTNLVPTITFSDRQLPFPIGGTFPMSEHNEILFVDVDGDGENEYVSGSYNLFWFNMDWMESATIQGQVFIDPEASCSTDDELAVWMDLPILIERLDGDNDQVVNTTEEGWYAALLRENGDYLIQPVLPSSYWEACPADTVVSVASTADDWTIDFSISPVVECPLMQMHLQSSFLRPCFNSTFYIDYENVGTITAEEATIQLQFDPDLILLSASFPYQLLNDSTVLFELGDVPILGSGQMELEFYVDCDFIALDDVLCFYAAISPDEICEPGSESSWDGSSLELSTFCGTDDQVRFRVLNAGTGGMSVPAPYQVSIVNDDIVLFLQDDVFLGPGEADTIHLPQPESDHAWLLQINQQTGHPVPDWLSIANAGCPIDSTYLDLTVPTVNGDLFTEELCQIVVGSYDPNNKIALPEGVGPMNWIQREWTIEYTINFQNTGTDTAFLVVLEDELSSLLDLSTFEEGNSSHPNFWTISDERKLIVTFPNILLPDSTTNLVESQGYFQFSIRPQEAIPPLSLIENEAAIFFDFNEPVITNTTRQRIPKPQVASNTEVALCAGDAYLGQTIQQDTSLYEFFSFAAYDSLAWHHLTVQQADTTTLQITLEEAGEWEGIPIDQDTLVLRYFVNQQGCDSTVIYQISLLTDLKEPAWANSVQLSPNPVQDQLWVKWEASPAQLEELVIYSALGHQMYQQTLMGGSHTQQLDLARLSPGIYFLELRQGSELYRWRFSKL